MDKWVKRWASNFYSSERCSDHAQEMIVKRKRKIQKSIEEHGKVKGSDGYAFPEWSTLPYELLDIISKKIDFVSFFALGGVCKNWRRFYGNYRGDVMASQAPLLILKSPQAKKVCTFFSLSEAKGYKTWLPNHWERMESSAGFWKSFVGFSSGYLIRQSSLILSKLWLINPFTRKELHIPESPCQGFGSQSDLVPSFHRVFLAFVVNSEDFVLLAMRSYSSNLFMYQSRKSSWAVYSTENNHLGVCDVAVFHNTTYAITGSGSIGIINLNSPNLKLLDLNVPRTNSVGLKLVSTNEELLVVDFKRNEPVKIYRIDLSKMEWVRLHSLGGTTLFVGQYMKGYALSNPSRWGYESNCVYYINPSYPVCHLYPMGNKAVRTVQYFVNEATSRLRHYPMAWCFPSVRDEIDYSLHD